MTDIKKQYFRKIKKNLSCCAKKKKDYLEEMDSSVEYFLQQNPEATIQDLYVTFGDPHTIADSFLEHGDPEQLAHKLSTKRRIVIGVIAVVSILAIVLGIIFFSFADDLHNYRNGYDVDIHYELPSNAIPSPLEEY